MRRKFVYISKYKILHKSILITVAKTCEKVLGLNMTSRYKVKIRTLFIVEESYNNTVTDFNFGRHKNLSTLKSDIRLGLAA